MAPAIKIPFDSLPKFSSWMRLLTVLLSEVILLKQTSLSSSLSFWNKSYMEDSYQESLEGVAIFPNHICQIQIKQSLWCGHTLFCKMMTPTWNNIRHTLQISECNFLCRKWVSVTIYSNMCSNMITHQNTLPVVSHDYHLFHFCWLMRELHGAWWTSPFPLHRLRL